MNRPLLVLSALAALSVPLAVEAATTRTHVSNAGNDANTSFSCDYAHPCRTFSAALSQTTAGGEILAIDSSGYGKLVIDRSVSIIAAPGVFAGVGVGASGSATGIEIGTAGVNVVLRGLTITGQGGNYGINMTNGASLSVENCVISNFSGISGIGIQVAAAANVRIVDSLLRDNYNATRLQGGATVSISNSKFLGNTNTAIDFYITSATGSVSDSVVSGNGTGWGIIAESSGGSTIKLRIARTVVTNHGTGVLSWTSGGTSAVYLSDSVVTGNTTGVAQANAGASFYTLGNNAVIDNGSNTSGTITPASPL